MKKKLYWILLLLIAAALTMVCSMHWTSTEVVDGVEWKYKTFKDKGEKCAMIVSGVKLGAMTIPSTLGGCPVKSICADAFKECLAMTSVTIPEGVTSIGKNAFDSCGRITSVNIPSSVEEIGASAFECCCRLKNVTIPPGVTSIEDSTFCGCGALESIWIPASVKRIGDYAFMSCEGLKSVSFASGGVSLGVYAFKGCDALKEIHFRDNEDVDEFEREWLNTLDDREVTVHYDFAEYKLKVWLKVAERAAD